MKLQDVIGQLMAEQSKKKIIFDFYNKKISIAKEFNSVSFEEIYQRWKYYAKLSSFFPACKDMIKSLYFTGEYGKRILHMSGDWVISNSGHNVTIYG